MRIQKLISFTKWKLTTLWALQTEDPKIYEIQKNENSKIYELHKMKNSKLYELHRLKIQKFMSFIK